MTTSDKSASRKRTDPEAEIYALGLLVEEAGEVGQLVGKALRFGIDTPGRLGPDGKVTGETPRTLLTGEVGDLLAAVDFALAHGLFDPADVTFARREKIRRLLNPDAADNLGRQLAPQPGAGLQASAQTLEMAVEQFVRRYVGHDTERRQGGYSEVFNGDLRALRTALRRAQGFGSDGAEPAKGSDAP